MKMLGGTLAGGVWQDENLKKALGGLPTVSQATP
jgi:hypothetical protein